MPTVIRSQFRSGSNTKKILPNISEDQLNTSEDYSKFLEEFSALSEGLLILSNLSEDIWPTIKDDITFRFQVLFSSCSLKEIKKYKFSSTANWTRPTGWYSLSLMPCSKFAWLLFLKQYHRNLRKQREY